MAQRELDAARLTAIQLRDQTDQFVPILTSDPGGIGAGLAVRVVSSPPGAGGGGIAQTQVRDVANVWTDVGYFGGNLSMPVSGTFWPTAAATPSSARLSDGVAFYDARSIRALTSSDVVNANQGTPAALANRWPVELQTGAATTYDARQIRALTSADVVTADTELPTAILLGDAVANPTAPAVGAFGMLYDPIATTWRRLFGFPSNADALGTQTNFSLVPVVAHMLAFNGTSWDRVQNLAVRTQPATTSKALPVTEIPNRVATYATATITISPAITIGVKELLALWYTGGTKDIYIMEIWASGLVTTASTTGGRTTVRVSTITTAPTGGTEEAKVDVTGAGASAITNTMRVKTGGGTIGNTFIRKLVWHATQAVGSAYDKAIFTAASVGDGLIMRGGTSSGFSIDIEREVAHTALVDSWTISVSWLEL